VFSRKPSSEPAAPAQTSQVNAAPTTESPAQNEAAQRQIAAVFRQTVAFAQIVSLLMRSPVYRHLSIGDIEWLVIPPLAAGTFALAEAKAQPDGPAFPAGAVLWASVSPEVDARLGSNLSAPVRLLPGEWRSGDLLWVVAGAGDPRVVNGILQQLHNAAFKGKRVKIRAAGAGGAIAVKTLDEVFAAQ
jgi:hemolysin-activating ACP:hemolysin acyltransferase